jgi:F0F1-type ATP synthase membrane subunit b/b'
MENLENAGKKVEETVQRTKDQVQSNVKPKTEHAEEKVRDTEQKAKQKLTGS